jgi:DNA helicase-2/ATP-dependent DNA helicase PcrA
VQRKTLIEEVDGLVVVDTDDFESTLGTEFASFFREGAPRLLSVANQEYISEQFLKGKLSVSALNNFVESPILYFFRNLIHLPDAKTAHLDFGNLIHGTLEYYFNECKKKVKILDEGILKESYEKILEANPAYQEFEERGWNILQKYFSERKSGFDVPLENEFRISAVPFELKDGQTLNLTGVMDKISRDKEGNIIVWDYKTGKAYSDMPKDRKEKIKRQAAFYKLLLRNAYGGKYDFQKAVFDFVEPNSKGGFEQASFEILPEDLDEVRDLIQELADTVLSGDLLKNEYKKTDKTKDYLELLELIVGDPEQGELF